MTNPIKNMKEEFSTFDVCEALNIPRERLRDWMVRGFVVPSVQADGAGTRALFDRIDVYLVSLFENLIEGGFPRKTASLFVEYIRIDKSTRSKLPKIDFIIAKRNSKNTWEVRWVSGSLPITENTKKADGWMQLTICNFKKIREEVDRRLKAL